MLSTNIIEEAVNNGELYEILIAGTMQKKEVELSTEAEAIFKGWEIFINTKTNPHYYWHLFEDTVVKISHNNELCWFSLYYLYLLLHFDKKNNSTNINFQLLIDILLNNIIKNKLTLVHDFRWVGNKKYSFSVWDDILRLVSVLVRDFNYNFHQTKLQS